MIKRSVEKSNIEQTEKSVFLTTELFIKSMNDILFRNRSTSRMQLSIVTVTEPTITLTDIYNELHEIPVNEILYITKENPYTVIKSTDMKKYGRLYFKDTLESIASRIQKLPLLAVNRSYIVQVFGVDHRDSRNLYIGDQRIGFRGDNYELCLQLFKTKKQGGGIANPQIFGANPQIGG
jgi:DNA-binding LytR/AlgR family response regulator